MSDQLTEVNFTDEEWDAAIEACGNIGDILNQLAHEQKHSGETKIGAMIQICLASAVAEFVSRFDGGCSRESALFCFSKTLADMLENDKKVTIN